MRYGRGRMPGCDKGLHCLPRWLPRCLVACAMAFLLLLTSVRLVVGGPICSVVLPSGGVRLAAHTGGPNPAGFIVGESSCAQKKEKPEPWLFVRHRDRVQVRSATGGSPAARGSERGGQPQGSSLGGTPLWQRRQQAPGATCERGGLEALREAAEAESPGLEAADFCVFSDR